MALAADEERELEAALLAALMDADEFVEIGTLMATVIRAKDPAAKKNLNLPLQEAVKSSLWSLDRSNVILVRDVDDIVDNHVVFEKDVERDEVIAFTDAYIASLGPDYPVFLEENADLVARAAAELGLSLNEKLKRFLADRSLVPASDRIVDLQHNSAAVGDTIEKLEVASETIRSSNALEPARRQALRDQIEVGIQLLKRPKVYLSAISAILLKPLYDAYCELAEGPAKAALEAALATVRNLIGL